MPEAPAAAGRGFAPAAVSVERRTDGSVILRSPQPLREYPTNPGCLLFQWAATIPERLFLAERDPHGGWRSLSYADAAGAASAVAQALIDRGLDQSRAVMVLSGNGIDHALMMLGAFLAGVPICPVSPAYSLVSADYGRLEHIYRLIEPALVYVASFEEFRPALEALGPAGAELVCSSGLPEGVAGTPFCELLATVHTPEVRRRAFDVLIAAYWKPVYKHVRIKWRADNEDAKDLTQEFFARAMEKGFFDRYDPARARFRTFLRTCVDGFVANQRKAAQRLKRGGEATILSLNFEAAERELRRIDVPDDADPDDQFRREWVRSLFGFAVDTLRVALATSGKDVYFDLFRRYDLEEDEGGARMTYDDLAKEFGISSSQVTNYLAYARREFRRIVLERLRTLSATDEEFREEARELFGMDPS